MNKAQKLLFTSIGIIIFAGILSFSFYHYTRYKKGPEIISINLQKFTSIEKPSLKVIGKIENTKSVKINERDIILENKKKFEEIIVFSPGDNIIEVLLEDAFGKKKSYLYHIYYNSEKEEYAKTLKEAKEIKTQEEKVLEENKQ
jgi:hypothetical protein